MFIVLSVSLSLPLSRSLSLSLSHSLALSLTLPVRTKPCDSRAALTTPNSLASGLVSFRAAYCRLLSRRSIPQIHLLSFFWPFSFGSKLLEGNLRNSSTTVRRKTAGGVRRWDRGWTGGGRGEGGLKEKIARRNRSNGQTCTMFSNCTERVSRFSKLLWLSLKPNFPDSFEPRLPKGTSSFSPQSLHEI